MTFGRPHAIPEDHEDPFSADGDNAKLMSVLFFVESMWALLDIYQHRRILIKTAENYIKCSTRSFQPYTNRT
jgi:hypothetical protein